jgi:hypothetical protein
VLALPSVSEWFHIKNPATILSTILLSPTQVVYRLERDLPAIDEPRAQGDEAQAKDKLGPDRLKVDAHQLQAHRGE